MTKYYSEQINMNTDYMENQPEKQGTPHSSSQRPIEARFEKIRKMKEESRKKLSFIDDFLDSEENQKKYGFTTDVVDGVRSIYYDGDIDVLNEAMYGPRIAINESLPESSNTMRLSSFDDKLYAQLPNTNDEIPVFIKIGTEESKTPYFSIQTETGMVLTSLCLKDPAYYPNEESCKYLINMRGFSVLNRYIRDNFHLLIEQWNSLHPSNTLDYDIPIPNYRFLASYSYSKDKDIVKKVIGGANV